MCVLRNLAYYDTCRILNLYSMEYNRSRGEFIPLRDILTMEEFLTDTCIG